MELPEKHRSERAPQTAESSRAGATHRAAQRRLGRRVPQLALGTGGGEDGTP